MLHRTLVLTTILALRWTTWGRLISPMARFKGPTHAADQLLVHLYQTWELLAGASYKLHCGNERCVANRSRTPYPLLRHLAHTFHIDLAPITVFNISTPSAKITTSAIKPRSACLFRLSKHTTSEGVRRRFGLSYMRRSYARKYDSLPTWGHLETGGSIVAILLRSFSRR